MLADDAFLPTRRTDSQSHIVEDEGIIAIKITTFWRGCRLVIDSGAAHKTDAYPPILVRVVAHWDRVWPGYASFVSSAPQARIPD